MLASHDADDGTDLVQSCPLFLSLFLFNQILNMSAIFGTVPEHNCGTSGVLLADERTDRLCKMKRRVSVNFQLQHLKY